MFQPWRHVRKSGIQRSKSQIVACDLADTLRDANIYFVGGCSSLPQSFCCLSRTWCHLDHHDRISDLGISVCESTLRKKDFEWIGEGGRRRKDAVYRSPWSKVPILLVVGNCTQQQGGFQATEHKTGNFCVYIKR